MFDTLEADIVVMQEAKIQRKDLRDDMVLVPGWDVYFSLPKYKKGYSGVAIYTRNAKCCPIRAEEGITGVLCPPNSSTRFRDLPEDQQIGGYPRPGQLSGSVDEATLDSEGRCVILEFPAFVLIGVYSPATRDETRTEFRLGFHEAMDARVRNLVAMGKQVILTGDLNIIRNELDTAGLQETLKKEDMTLDDFLNTPSRRFMNHLVFGGKVLGKRDEGREEPVLWDLCREFHPDRQGMYTCWETRKNARPGNYGSRIDYVLCSSGIKDWFTDANIQEGLLGSDHCPVYATLRDTVEVCRKTLHVVDKMNPDGMFVEGKRVLEWTTKHLLPTSAKLIPEFDRRRSIRDMFFKPARPAEKNKSSPLPGTADSRKTLGAPPSTPGSGSIDPAEDKERPAKQTSTGNDPLLVSSLATGTSVGLAAAETDSVVQARDSQSSVPKLSRPTIQTFHPGVSPNRSSPVKRAASSPSPARPAKKGKATLAKESSMSGASKSQSSLMGFFKPKTRTPTPTPATAAAAASGEQQTDGSLQPPPTAINDQSVPAQGDVALSSSGDLDSATDHVESLPPDDADQLDSSSNCKFIDPIQSKESWSKLLGKRVPPKCEHDEPCISLLTKKPGVNCGRSFYICPRPLGPTGDKEAGTPFRCRTFIWSSDWNGRP
ncbi:Class II abasic (AP) endonuclease, variant 2 [Coniochaeta pulveracea]|uniref:DNA-(apurinic or apyrimidinic site) endonuclease 2 n=2 Tax=Coniochaeta pulveracea TaxID=177199 RepID=A0A420Y292_9PEZI|nr:Class II abasic (AP) endonuclease, variant 2 [Coniochaeta pulveracea]